MSTDILLDVKNLTTEFMISPNLTLKAVDNVSFTVKKGEILGIVGESGCGKTVTSLSILGLVKSETSHVSAGTVQMKGRNLLNCSSEELRAIRGREISIIFQEPMMALNPVLRIETQLLESLQLQRKISKKEGKELAIEMLNNVGIPNPEIVALNYPHQLSGGICQRVMIAMAMSSNPDLLIADEPTTSLDVTIQAQILSLMQNIQNNNNTGIILITHDLGIVAQMCSRVLVMYAGKILEEAPVMEIFEEPKHPYTRGLLASVPKLGSGITSLPYIPGNVPDLSMLPQGCKFSPRCPNAREQCQMEEPDLYELNPVQKARCFQYKNLNIENNK